MFNLFSKEKKTEKDEEKQIIAENFCAFSDFF